MSDSNQTKQETDAIRLRVTDAEPNGDNDRNSEPASTEMRALGPSTPTPNDPAPIANNDNKTLTEIITNPDAPEHEWLQAAHELNKQEIIKHKQRTKFRRRLAIAGLSLAIVTGLAAVIAPILHISLSDPFNQTQQISDKLYIRALQAEIKKHWHPPPGEHIVQVAFKVHKNGEISDLRFERMSRSSEKDAAALKAIEQAMPSLPPLPAGSPESVDIVFTFEYHDHSGPTKDNPKQHEGD